MYKEVPDNEMFIALEKFAPKSTWECMYMGAEEVDDKIIYQYKMCGTRRYLYIDKDGNFYQYYGGDIFIKISKRAAVKHALS